MGSPDIIRKVIFSESPFSLTKVVRTLTSCLLKYFKTPSRSERINFRLRYCPLSLPRFHRNPSLQPATRVPSHYTERKQRRHDRLLTRQQTSEKYRTGLQTEEKITNGDNKEHQAIDQLDQNLELNELIFFATWLTAVQTLNTDNLFASHPFKHPADPELCSSTLRSLGDGQQAFLEVKKQLMRVNFFTLWTFLLHKDHHYNVKIATSARN